MPLDVYLDELQRYADHEFHHELLAARAEYFADLGRVHEDDQLFEAHLDRFLDWFMFERRLPDSGRTLLETYIERLRAAGAESLAVFEGFAGYRHGLFVVRKLDKLGVHLRDAVTREKLFVADEVPAAFTKKQIFEARLLPLAGELHFSKSYIFHPLSAARDIKKRIKQIGREDADGQRALLRDLAIRRLKADRYPHVDPRQFYQF